MSCNTLYLHVGMDKTGTSAIQYFMRENKDKLMNNAGLCYPSAGLWQDFSHHQFAFSAIGQHGYSVNNLYELFPALMNEAGAAKSAIISSECLFKIPLKEGSKIFFELISKYFGQVKVIVYLRRQDEWVESRHKHSIISGHELSLEMLMRPHFCDYKQFIDRWANVLSPEDIIVRPYEKQQFTGTNIFADFLSIFDIALSDDYVLPAVELNVSLGNDELEFKKLCNKVGFLTKGVDALNRALISRTKSSVPNQAAGRLLSPLDRLDLIETYSDINKNIAVEYLDRKDGNLFYDNLPDSDESWGQYPGIDRQAISDIGEYIYKRDIGLFWMLKYNIKSAIKSTDTDIAGAGEMLSNILNYSRKAS